jgi:hypothetical protein
MEDWTEIKLHNLPNEMLGKRILGLYFKNVNDEN